MNRFEILMASCTKPKFNKEAIRSDFPDQFHSCFVDDKIKFVIEMRHVFKCGSEQTIYKRKKKFQTKTVIVILKNFHTL